MRTTIFQIQIVRQNKAVTFGASGKPEIGMAVFVGGIGRSTGTRVPMPSMSLVVTENVNSKAKQISTICEAALSSAGVFYKWLFLLV